MSRIPTRSVPLLASPLALLALLSPTAPAQGAGNPTLLVPPPLTPEQEERRRTPVALAVEKTAASVINVYVQKGSQPRQLNLFADAERDFQLQGQGSGVIVDAGGLAITNWHVVASATESDGAQKDDHRVEITLPDGTRHEARVLSTAPSEDLALLRIEVPDGVELNAITVGDSESMRIGETVIAIGNPRGHASSVTVGVLSARDREIWVRTPDNLVRKYKSLLQTDAAINPGNSGGALIDINGHLVGINNAGAIDVPGIGFAIPVSTVRRVFRDVLLSGDRLRSVELGLKLVDEDGKVVVGEVVPGGPAARAGIVAGDVLIRLGSLRPASSLDVFRAALDLAAGTRLEVVVERDGEERVCELAVMGSDVWAIWRRTGMLVAAVDAGTARDVLRAASVALEREHTGDPQAMPARYLETGITVEEVADGSAADLAGIEAGDLFLGLEVVIPGELFDTTELQTYDDVAEMDERTEELARKPGARHRVWLFRDGEIVHGELRLKRLD